jgi:hypothetical protein
MTDGHFAPEPDALHVEVTVSTHPIGYIGRDADGSYVKRRTPEEVRAAAEGRSVASINADLLQG